MDFFLHDNSLYSSVTIVINLFRKYIEDYFTIFGKEEFTDIFDSCLLGNNVVKSDLIKEFSLAIYFVSALVMGELLYRTNNFLLRKY